MKIRAVLNATLSLVRLVINLFFIWLTLGWKVRKTRKTFEKQLILQGISSKDAKRLSAFYSRLKDELMNSLKSAAFRGF